MKPIRRTLALTVASAMAVIAPAATAGAAGATTRPAYQLPPPNGQFDYQIGGIYAPDDAVRIVDRDRTAKPDDAAGIYNVCYINAFQSQAEEKSFWLDKHPKLLLRKSNGKLVQDPGWPGEYMLNTATAASRARLAKIEDKWLDGCQGSGFDAVEPDNLDSNTRSDHMLTKADNFAFAQLLIAHAHEIGIAIAQKNSAEDSKQGSQDGFDFAIAEECQVYNECGHYLKYYGDEVYEVEYTDNPLKYYTKACADHGDAISVILRDRNVSPRGSKHYHYEAC